MSVIGRDWNTTRTRLCLQPASFKGWRQKRTCGFTTLITSNLITTNAASGFFFKRLKGCQRQETICLNQRYLLESICRFELFLINGGRHFSSQPYLHSLSRRHISSARNIKRIPLVVDTQVTITKKWEMVMLFTDLSYLTSLSIWAFKCVTKCLLGANTALREVWNDRQATGRSPTEQH